MNISSCLSLLLLTFLLSACGGGGGGSPAAVGSGQEDQFENFVIQVNDVRIDSGTVHTLEVPPSSVYQYALWMQKSGPEVGIISDEGRTLSFRAPVVTAETTLGFEALVVHADGRAKRKSITVTVIPGIVHSGIEISGRVTLDHIPHQETGALDFGSIERISLQRAEIQVVDIANKVVATSNVENGAYTFSDLSLGSDVKIRILSRTVKSEPAGWNISVVDNTNEGALYALESGLITIGANQKNYDQDLHASSGWSTIINSYSAPRAAAPFHILHNAALMVDKIHEADSTLSFPALIINWSVNNKPVSGPENAEIGHIGTSFYRPDDSGLANLYLLGDSTTDADDFDGQVILHELGHYFEDKLSRSDSIGGSHSSSEYLDPRVAFGEGFGNAWAGMISNDAIYADSSTGANGAAEGFAIDMENDTPAQAGWWNELTVENILFDAYDDNSLSGSDTDTLQVAWADIVNAFTNNGGQKDTPAFTSIFSYSKALKEEIPTVDISAWETLLADNNIDHSANEFGPANENYTVNGSSLRYSMHHPLQLGSTLSSVCTDNNFGRYNKAFNRVFATYSATQNATYQIQITASGDNAFSNDPDFALYVGNNKFMYEQSTGTTESASYTGTGDLRIELYDYNSIGRAQGGNARSCFNITISMI